MLLVVHANFEIWYYFWAGAKLISLKGNRDKLFFLKVAKHKMFFPAVIWTQVLYWIAGCIS